LKTITQNKTPEDHVVYRGFGSRKGLDLTKLKKGNVLRDKGFVSTSFRPEVAEEFSNGRDMSHIAKIHVPKGSKAHYIPHQGEHELLLHPNTKFKVIGHSFGGGENSEFQHIVHMKVVR
jgi:hypothetical protein